MGESAVTQQIKPPPGFVPVAQAPPPGFVPVDPSSAALLDLDGVPKLDQVIKNPGFQNPSERSQRTTPEKIGRGLGLGARHLVEGATLPFTAGGDLLSKGVNVVLDAFGSEHRLPENRVQTIAKGLTDAGFPEPETAAERIVQAIDEGIVTAGFGIATGANIANSANATTAGVGRVLQSNPVMQGASAIAGTGAAAGTAESGGSPLQVFMAGLLGAFTPAAARLAGGAAVRGGFRGGEAGRQGVQDKIDTFARAGDTPTVSQATGGRVAQAAESGLGKAPGGAGQIANKSSSQQTNIGRRVEQIADDLAPKATPEKAGLAIQRGIKGDGGFVERHQARADILYDDVDQFLDVNTPVQPIKTQAFLRQATTPAKGAEATSKLFINKLLDDVDIAISDDLGRALETKGILGLPYHTLKDLRTLIGRKLQGMTLVENISKGELKRLYGALSDDLTAAAKAAPNPKAGQAASRADAFYKGFMGRIDALEGVVNKAGGEKVFNAALSGTKDGATLLRTVMKSLKPEEQKILTAAVIRRLGKATPGKQIGDDLDAFSMQTYLTNFAKLSPEARGTLFGRFGPKLIKDTEALVSVASDIRSGAQVFANPSGTGQMVSLQALSGLSFVTGVMGNLKAAAAIAAIPIGTNLSARLMTNPTFVRMLASSATLPPGTAPAFINGLAQAAKQSGDRDLALAAALLQESQNQQTDDPNGAGQQQ